VVAINQSDPHNKLLALNSKPSRFAGFYLMAYTVVELKANSVEASFCFRPETIGDTSDKGLSIPVAFDHNSTNHNSFIGVPN
jgi:hypothetical protein